jgi:hypothetical protein
MIRRVLSGSFGSANKTATAVCGKRSVRNSRGQWRCHSVFIRCTKFSINLGNLIEDECDPLYYMRC